MNAFEKGTIALLICTELLGRGIDFKGVNTVVNFDLPTSLVSYVHRVGEQFSFHSCESKLLYFFDSSLSIILRPPLFKASRL